MKNYILLIGFIVIVAMLFINRNNQRQRDMLTEQVAVLNTRNEMLIRENKQISKEIEDKDLLLKTKEHQADSVNKLYIKAKKDAAYWKHEHDQIAEQLEGVSYDDSYAFLMMVYSFKGDPKYLFNEMQVHAMHKTYLENENKLHQINSIETALKQCETERGFMGESMDVLKDKYNLKSTQYDNLNTVVGNKDEEIKLIAKQLKRKIFWSKVKNVALPVAFVAGFVIGL